MSSHPTTPAPQAWTPDWLAADWANRRAVLGEAAAATSEAITWFEFQRDTTRGAKKSTREVVSLLERFFALDLPVDGKQAPPRPVTLPELLAPGSGDLLAAVIAEMLEDLPPDVLRDQVAIDMRKALRVFCRFVVKAHRLKSGFDLKHRYGELACPIGDRDVPSRIKQRVHLVPTLEELPYIYAAGEEWADKQRLRWEAWRTFVIFAFACATGLRGEEIVQLALHRQFVPAIGPPRLRKRVIGVVGAKGGLIRQTAIDDDYAFDLVNWWLEDERPAKADPYKGPFFPNAHAFGAHFTRPSLTSTTRRLIKHLISEGFLDEQFTFHATRKTWARHFMVRSNNDVPRLLGRAGWADTSQLATYLALHPDEAIADSLANRVALEEAA